jgi:hypothetical protein
VKTEFASRCARRAAIAASVAAAVLAGFALWGCRSEDRVAGRPAGPSDPAPAAGKETHKPPAAPPAPKAASAQVAPHPMPERLVPKKPIDRTKKPSADNSRCFVCHLNYDEEPFVVWHSYASVGCESCHGPSDDHCGDEEHTTPPTIMYAREAIAAACWKCHSEVKPEKGFKPPAGADLTKVCTDCHGSHRLKKRERRWDKATRKLLQ